MSSVRSRSGRRRSTTALRASAMACVLCLGVAAPAAVGATGISPSGVTMTEGEQALFADQVIRDVRQDDTAGGGSVRSGVPAGQPVAVVVTPGTDDGTLDVRIKGLVGDSRTFIIDYPESMGPLVSGRSDAFLLFAPRYDASKQVALDNNREVMRYFGSGADERNPFVVYTGYSQGADALGDAAEQAVAAGELDTENSLILLISDPRSPWGLKSWAFRTPLVGLVFTVFGAESNGARDPEATGDADVVSVIIVGDPVADFQWTWYRPVSSLAVNAAGFLTIHSGGGPQTYGDLDELGDPTYLHSGGTTYVVYDAHHPFALLLAKIYDDLGIAYDDEDLGRWDTAAETFYATQAPTVGNADTKVTVGNADTKVSVGDGPNSVGDDGDEIDEVGQSVSSGRPAATVAPPQTSPAVDDEDSDTPRPVDPEPENDTPETEPEAGSDGANSGLSDADDGPEGGSGVEETDAASNPED